MTKDNNPTVDIVCILDRSGSMTDLAKDTIGAFNNFLSEQQADAGKARITLVLFDNEYEVVWDRIKLKKANPIDSSIYFARGMTALNDAMGKAISSIDKKQKHCIVLVITDGEENYSKEFNTDQVKSLVKKKEKKGWKFQFIGAGIDAFAVGHAIGINTVDISGVSHTSTGIHSAYVMTSASAMDYRKTARGDTSPSLIIDSNGSGELSISGTSNSDTDDAPVDTANTTITIDD